MNTGFPLTLNLCVTMRPHCAPAGTSETQARTPSADAAWGNVNSSSWLVGMRKGAAALPDSLAVSYKAKCSLTVWPSSHIPWYLPKWVQNSCPNKNMHANICNNFICNFKYLKTTRKAFSRWMGELWYIHTMEYYSVIKGNEPSSHERMQGALNTNRHTWEI